MTLWQLHFLTIQHSTIHVNSSKLHILDLLRPISQSHTRFGLKTDGVSCHFGVRQSKVGYIHCVFTFPHSRKHEIHFLRQTFFLLAFALDESFNCKGVLFVTLRLNTDEYWVCLVLRLCIRLGNKNGGCLLRPIATNKLIC